MKLYHYVYKTTNPISGKYCYGKHSTNNLKDRYQGSGKWVEDCKKSKIKLKTEIIEFLNTENEAYQLEKFLVEKFRKDKKNMNMVAGGHGFQSGKTHALYGRPMSEEQKKKISLAQKGKPRWSKKDKKRIGDQHRGENSYWYGKKLPDEIREKISKANLGDKNGMKRFGFKVRGKNNGMYGKTHSEENRKRMSEAAKKYWADKRKENENTKVKDITPEKDDTKD